MVKANVERILLETGPVTPLRPATPAAPFLWRRYVKLGPPDSESVTVRVSLRCKLRLSTVPVQSTSALALPVRSADKRQSCGGEGARSIAAGGHGGSSFA